MQDRGPCPHPQGMRRLLLMQDWGLCPHLWQDVLKSRCQRSQTMQGILEDFRGRCAAFSTREMVFSEGFVPVTEGLVWWCVNVMMTRRSSVLVEIQGIGLGMGRA